MVVGVPKEIKKDEYRVALVPSGAAALHRHGHTVLVEAGAGHGSNIPDRAYVQAGAEIIDSPAPVFKRAQLILKVKEPQPEEYKFLRPSQIVFTFFHFAANKGLAQAMLKSKVTCLAYETVEDAQGQLPILIPMSEVAGRMSVQEGAKYLEKPMKGKGILLGGIPGVAPANILILGGGVVVMDVDLDRLRYLEDIMPKNVSFLMSNEHNIAECVERADLVICAALLRGARSPILIPRWMLKKMRPGAVPNTSTYGLTNATLPFALEITNKGLSRSLKENPALARGLNIARGKVTYRSLAQTLELPFTPLSRVLS